MKIERIREILRSIPIKEDGDEHAYDDQSETWECGFEEGIAEALKFLEAEAMSEVTIIDEALIFDKSGMCNILGGK